jgi:hypothetical protein
MHMAKPRVSSTPGGVEGEQSERHIKLITEYLFESHLTHATPRQNVDRIETARSSLARIFALLLNELISTGAGPFWFREHSLIMRSVPLLQLDRAGYSICVGM